MATNHPEVTAMIAKLPSPQKEICEQLRTMIGTEFPAVEEKWGWSRPLYAVGNKQVCYMVANKNDVNFGFDQGANLDDPKGLLAGTGAKMRHLKIRKLEEADFDYYKQLVAQALNLVPTA